MNLQFRFGIAGAGLGMFIGIIGCVFVAPPFGIVVFRIILSSLIGGAFGFALYFVLKNFLPELLDGNMAVGEPMVLENGADSRGQAVNITLPEEGFSTQSEDASEDDDQASALRRVYEGHRNEDADMDSSLIAEVSEDRRGAGAVADLGQSSSFNEDAFYQGVERLPDIGGFSEQFQEQDADGTIVGDEGTPMMSSTPSGKRPMSGNKDIKGNMDPELIAKAIRTALKKDDL